MSEREIPFADGNVSAAVRVGDTVRRTTGPWTPAVHALLRHLEAVGFAGAPRVLGMDAKGREILSFLPGESCVPWLAGCADDATLVAVARYVRAYHDAVAGFQPPAGAAWRFTVGAPRTGDVICHNDLAPWNAIFDQGRLTGFVDWDFATPGPRLWDVAYALWRFAPLNAEDDFGPPAERARRMILFCDAYGLTERAGLLAMIARRQQALYDTLKTWGEAGVPAFAEMWQTGHADYPQRDLAYLRRHRQTLAELVERW